MRLRLVVLAALLAASISVGVTAAPAFAAGGTCFGHAATVTATGNNYFYLTSGDDVVVGTSGIDYVMTTESGGTDYICTGSGGDSINIDVSAATSLDSGAGNDSLIVSGSRPSASAIINLGSGNDTLIVVNLAVAVTAGSGKDVVTAYTGTIYRGSSIDGGSGDDAISASIVDNLYGGSGRDYVADTSVEGATLMDCGSATDTYFETNTVSVVRCEQREL